MLIKPGNTWIVYGTYILCYYVAEVLDVAPVDTFERVESSGGWQVLLGVVTQVPFTNQPGIVT